MNIFLKEKKDCVVFMTKLPLIEKSRCVRVRFSLEIFVN